MPFGKHKGTPLSKVPRQYLSWLLRNADNLYPETKEAIQHVLNGGQTDLEDAGEKPAQRRGRARGGVHADDHQAQHGQACQTCGIADGQPMVHLACQDDEVPF